MFIRIYAIVYMDIFFKVVIRLVRTILIGFIRIYQKLISPLKPPTCRFYPTCSHYGLEAIKRFGAIKGSWLTVKRIVKCHPFHPGGFDHVPEKNATHLSKDEK